MRRLPREWPDAATWGRVCAATLRSLPCLLVLVLGAVWTPIATAAAVPGGVAASAASPEDPGEPQEMILGVVVGSREVAVVEVYWDGEEFLLPLDRFRDFCQCDVTLSGQGVRVLTPIGAATLGAEQLVERGGTTYLRGSVLPSRLAMPFDYDPRRMALVIDLPWSGMPASAPPDVSLDPDVAAPDLQLAYAATSAVYTRQGNGDSASGNALFMGRVAGGQWRARINQTQNRGPGLEEYGWTRPVGERSLLLLGHQRLDLHPLLEPLELTGLQAAWTNAPLTVFGQGRVAGELLPRQLSTRTTISGYGVPAGIAVLRVDDRRVASTVIDLGGFYEFTGVQIPTGGRRVEVLIYDRQNPTVPVDIQEHAQRASDALLPAGAAVVQGALGDSGNPFGLPLTRDQGPSGFAQGRYGVSPGLTLESAVQQGANGTGLMAGGVAQLGRGFVLSAAGGLAGGALGHQLELDGDLSRWRLRARSLSQGAGYRFLGSPAIRDHYLEVARTLGTGLELGMIGRSQSGLGPDVSFLLPSVAWRPSASLMLRARPDTLGEYRFDLNWLPNRDWRVGLTRSGAISTATASRRISQALRAQAFAQVDDFGGTRQAAMLAWTGDGRYSPALSGGPLLSNGRLGVLLSAQAEVVPGVLLGLRYESSSLLASPVQGPSHRLSLTLSTRHAISGTRVLPAVSPMGTRRVGSIAGRVQAPASVDLAADALSNMTIRLNGRGAGRTRRGGGFYLPNLEPGVYRVEFDADTLPIELTPRARVVLVEVAAGSVTDVEFHLDVEYGIAGRVRIGTAHAPDLRLEVVDTAGAVVATTRTDRWGLYRVDGLRVGSYTVRIAADNAPGLEIEWPARTVRLTDDFLFDQDLDLVDAAAGLLAAAGESNGSPADVSETDASREREVDPAAPVDGTVAPSTPGPDSRPEDLDHGFAGHVLDRVTVSARMPAPDLVPMPHVGARARPLAPPAGQTSAVVVAWAPQLQLVALSAASPRALPVADARSESNGGPVTRVVPPASDAPAPSSAPSGPAAVPGTDENDRSTRRPGEEEPRVPPRRSEPIARYWRQRVRERPGRSMARNRRGVHAKGIRRARGTGSRRADGPPVRTARVPAR